MISCLQQKLPLLNGSFLDFAIEFSLLHCYNKSDRKSHTAISLIKLL